MYNKSLRLTPPTRRLLRRRASCRSASGGVQRGRSCMHWLLHLLVDAVLVFGLVASYCAYQEHRRKQSEYARVQLYEDADKPCVPAPLLAPAPARGCSSRPCSARCQALGSSAWPSRACFQPRSPSACRPRASVCGGTPEAGGWTDPDDRDDVELTSIAAGQEKSVLGPWRATACQVR